MLPKKHIPEDIEEGEYLPVVQIFHSPWEFYFDFGYVTVRADPSEQEFKVKRRIKMSPSQAKAFLNALKENIERYETAYGTIKLPGEAP